MTSETRLPPPGEAMVRRSSGEQAALYIRRLIFDGRLRQGDRVPQDEIARTLGVSRIPVREALLSLEREGWVTIRPHRGAFIGALDEAAVRDHYALYGLVYGFAARRATERSDPALVERLAAVCEKLAAEDDPAEVARLNRDFDRLILGTASSPRLRAVLRAMVGIVPGNFFALVPGAIDVEREGSRAVVAAVRAGDGEAAADAYAHMLKAQGDLVAALFTTRGLFPT
ncbi:GntR family transcriptional regulator [Actinocorallia sp. A-T 12471]|uniref:GntR family transcriptional regulator n=1 Tax=Actinocorallia sp. A-T 12471 TaxID=3089813 RepID=UPI0029CBFEE9|nr:GntR family transcriptional regulator [Actinocorallia sp. A-T 12471]MDX6740956.1 GntR family transcriptional regulator [Actinocorallia sp. A-T 12471]